MKKKGKLYLIPSPLGETPHPIVPEYVLSLIHKLEYFIVEKAKTARRYIKKCEHPRAIQELSFFELNKHKDDLEWRQYLNPIHQGVDVGLLSEAGCPGIADPGAEIVAMAHQKNIEVVPLIGPSSILLSLIASGLNGQSFTFHGYLSPKKERIGKDLKRLETTAKKINQTQIFIETPYRNKQVVEQALKLLDPKTRFCIAMDLTLPSQFIRTKTIKEWQKLPLPDLHKRPAVFLLL